MPSYWLALNSTESHLNKKEFNLQTRRSMENFHVMCSSKTIIAFKTKERSYIPTPFFFLCFLGLLSHYCLSRIKKLWGTYTFIHFFHSYNKKNEWGTSKKTYREITAYPLQVFLFQRKWAFLQRLFIALFAAKCHREL